MKKQLQRSVFIVDDDPDDREAIRDAFLENKHEHRYTFMKNADQLFTTLLAGDTGSPYLIMLDLNMPGKDGKDVLRELKSHKDYQLIPIIILTTSSSEKDRDVSYELGANCFITKPGSYGELVTITDSIARLWLAGE